MTRLRREQLGRCYCHHGFSQAHRWVNGQCWCEICRDAVPCNFDPTIDPVTGEIGDLVKEPAHG